MNFGAFPRFALVAILAATAAGCSEPEKEGESYPEPPIKTVATVTSVENVTLPMDAFTQTPQQRALDYQANDLLVAQCMERSGATFEGDAASRAELLSRLAKMEKDNRFGLVDRDIAAQYGYHKQPDPGAGAGKGGAATKECSKEAKLALGKDSPPAEEFQLSFQLESDARARMQADSRYKEVVAKWSACMKQAGYEYATPIEAIEDPAWQKEATPSDAELQTAVTDVKCKTEVNYLGWSVALMTAYEEQLMDEHEVVLQRLRKYYEERSRKVLDLLKQNNVQTPAN